MHLISEALRQYNLGNEDISVVNKITVVPYGKVNDRFTRFSIHIDLTTKTGRTFTMGIENCNFEIIEEIEEKSFNFLVPPDMYDEIHLKLERTQGSHTFIKETTPPKKLTIKEIEAALGYKIQVIG